MKVIVVGTLTPDQQKQLAYDLLEFFYQAHRHAEKTCSVAPASDDASMR
ncbi:hypothetical protein [Sulfobacillus thermosulfidooxidans]|nr:hypothetical protein [Sulfobacillus thermosulfidooxidans]